MNFIRKQNINVVHNCFLMPTEKNIVIEKGIVSLEMLHALGLKNIQIRLLPAAEIFEKYLSNQKLDVAYLKLREESKPKNVVYNHNQRSMMRLSMVAEPKAAYNVRLRNRRC